MTTNTKLNIGQSLLLLSSIGLVSLIILNKALDWKWPWYFLVILALFCLGCGGYAVKLTDQAEKQRALAHMAGRPALSETEFGKRYFTSDKAEIAAKLRIILRDHLDVDLSQMQPLDRFVEDLRMDALDSMSTVEFVIDVEQKFGIKIPDSAAEKMRTFQEVVDYVVETVKAKET
jgi:acyl carrier protein